MARLRTHNRRRAAAIEKSLRPRLLPVVSKTLRDIREICFNHNLSDFFLQFARDSYPEFITKKRRHG